MTSQQKSRPLLSALACLFLIAGCSGVGDDDDSSPVGDDDSTATGDDDSTATGDDDATATGDDDSTATGDDDSTATGDDDSTLIDLTCDESHPDWTVGLKTCDPDAYQGYTLFAPMQSKMTYLLDMYGQLVHSWESDYTPALSVYLLEDGSLLRTLDLNKRDVFDAGGGGGGVELRDWDGTRTWSYEYADMTHLLHHDVERLPDGNVLMIAWELKSAEAAEAAGRDPDLLEAGELWPDQITEVAPLGDDSGEIVWEWHVWDHLIQDYDPDAPNYGVVSEHPERIDLNFTDHSSADWTHINSVDYNSDLDQIILSVHGFSEIWVIDHSTTSEEAATGSGGLYGHGGDLLYRWGNPQTYDAGSENDQMYFSQHDAQWIEGGLPGKDNILVFNNGPHGDEQYSTVDEMVPPVQVDGTYLLEGDIFGPDAMTWTYQATPPTDLYSSNISGAQRLANGNTLICSGTSARFLEVTSSGDIVWEYISPIGNNGILSQGDDPTSRDGGGPVSAVFRAYRYAPDYTGLQGRGLTSQGYLEQ